MTNRVAWVMNGFVSLSETERRQFLDEAQDYEDEDDDGRDVVRKSLKKAFRDRPGVNTGPVSSGVCTCCGK